MSKRRLPNKLKPAAELAALRAEAEALACRDCGCRATITMPDDSDGYGTNVHPALLLCVRCIVARSKAGKALVGP